MSDIRTKRLLKGKSEDQEYLAISWGWRRRRIRWVDDNDPKEQSLSVWATLASTFIPKCRSCMVVVASSGCRSQRMTTLHSLSDIRIAAWQSGYLCDRPNHQSWAVFLYAQWWMQINHSLKFAAKLSQDLSLPGRAFKLLTSWLHNYWRNKQLKITPANKGFVRRNCNVRGLVFQKSQKKIKNLIR